MHKPGLVLTNLLWLAGVPIQALLHQAPRVGAAHYGLAMLG